MKALILALVVIGAFATQSEVIEQIKRMDATRFGRTLFDTIYLQLEAKEPIDALLNTLSELEERYYAEQKEDDGNHQEFQSVCDYDIKLFDQDLANSDRERIVLEAKLEGELYPKKQIVSAVLGAKQKELQELQLTLAELDQAREEEAAEFEDKVAEHAEATAIISECRSLFTENMSAPGSEDGFLQRSNKIHPQATVSAEGLQLVQKHLLSASKRASKFTYRKSWGKFFKALATISSRITSLVEQSGVERIVQLCDDLLEQISDSLDLERFAEDKRVETYKQTRHLLSVTINATESTVANLQTELASVNDQIAQNEATLENTNQRIETVSEKREVRYEQCEQEAGDYQDARSARDNDRQTVSDTIGLVNAQLRTLREQLALRMQAGDSFD